MRGYVQIRTGMQEIGYVKDHYHLTQGQHGRIHAVNRPPLLLDLHHRVAGELDVHEATLEVTLDAKAEEKANTRKGTYQYTGKGEGTYDNRKGSSGRGKGKSTGFKGKRSKGKDAGGAAQTKAGLHLLLLKMTLLIMSSPRKKNLKNGNLNEKSAIHNKCA